MEGAISVRSMFQQLKRTHSPVEIEAIEVRLKHLFEESKSFSICDVRQIAQVITRVPETHMLHTHRHEMLRSFHCVDYAKLRHVTKDDIFRETIYYLAECYSAINKTNMSFSVNDFMDDVFSEGPQETFYNYANRRNTFEGDYQEEEPNMEELKQLGHVPEEQDQQKSKKGKSLFGFFRKR